MIRNRSIDLALFLTALSAGPDYHFIGIDLQRDEAALLARRGDIRTHCDDLADFCDIAALVSQMDRLVAVDTSVAHLAGALGIDTHILLPFTPDWRWGLGTSERIWYNRSRFTGRQCMATGITHCHRLPRRFVRWPKVIETPLS